MRWLPPLLLFGALASASDVEDRIAALASEDFAVRRHAQRWLRANAERCRPALERGLASRDAEVRAVCRRLLVHLGWVDPLTLEAVTPELLDGLRSADPQQRKRAAMKVAVSNRLGLEGLEAVYRGHVAALSIRPAQASVFADYASLPIQVTNVDTRPGWVGFPSTSLEARDRKPFGRSVTFPYPVLNRSIGLGGAFGCGWRRGRQTVINQADRFQWLEPGRWLRGTSVSTHVRSPGRYRARIRAAFEHRSFDLYNAHENLPRTTIRVDCPESADSAEFTLFAIPPREKWGAAVQTTRLEAFVRNGRVLLRLSSDGASVAPRDFSSTWRLVLDGRHQVLEHGPLVGREDDPRRYGEADLVRAERIEHSIPLPERRGVALLFGTVFSRGTPAGQLVVSNRLVIPR